MTSPVDGGQRESGAATTQPGSGAAAAERDD